MLLRRILVWFARIQGARIVSEPTPRPGEIWIAREFGLVRRLLPGCQLAWVSAGHDTDEPFHCGVPQVLTGSPSLVVSFDDRDSQKTLREILDWIRSS
jgi:hypothetical protein